MNSSEPPTESPKASTPLVDSAETKSASAAAPSSSSSATPVLAASPSSSSSATPVLTVSGSVPAVASESVIDTGLDLTAFTADQARRLAASVCEQEAAPKLEKIRADCWQQIRRAIQERQKECTFEIPVTSSAQSPLYAWNSYLCEAMVKHLERDLAFVVIRKFSFQASRLLLRWNHEGTRLLSVDELQRLKSEMERKKFTFSAYHAVLYERELQSQSIERALQQLSKEAVRQIILSIHEHKTSFVFEVPFDKYGVCNGRERNDLYDALVEQLSKGGYEVTDQMKTAYKFRIHCISDPEVMSVEEHPLPHATAPGQGAHATEFAARVNRSPPASSAFAMPAPPTTGAFAGATNAWMSTPITPRAQQTLKDFSHLLAQQQHIKFQMQRIQQQLQQQQHLQQSHPTAPSLYNQHAQLVYRLQQVDTHLITLSQSLLRQLSFAECYGQQPPVPTAAPESFAFMDAAPASQL